MKYECYVLFFSLYISKNIILFNQTKKRRGTSNDIRTRGSREDSDQPVYLHNLVKVLMDALWIGNDTRFLLVDSKTLIRLRGPSVFTERIF